MWNVLVTSVVIVVLSIIVVWFAWRLLSEKYALPCPAWLAWFVELDNPFFRINRADQIIRMLGLTSGMIVLDVGCGPGRLTIPVARAVGPSGMVFAMDIQDQMLIKVQTKARKENLDNITLLHAGIGQDLVNANVFDRALMVTVLGEIPNQKQALTEVLKVLKSGGILSVTEIIADPHFQSRGHVRCLAESVGFIHIQTFGSCVAYTMHLQKPS